MRTAKVTAYFNTGFTGINSPDSPDLFETPFYRNNSKELQVINCLPLSGEPMVSITVKDYSGLEQTDYIKMEFTRGIEGEYDPTVPYFGKVKGYHYLTSDTVTIDILMDFWLTCGGIKNLQSASGITSRVHVPKADDQLFAFTEPDEMINPARVLEVKTETWDIADITNEEDVPDKEIVLSTLDLYAMGYIHLYGVPEMLRNISWANAIAFADENDEKVIVPKPITIGTFPYGYLVENHFSDPSFDIFGAMEMAYAKYGYYGKLYVDCPWPTNDDWFATQWIDVTPPKIGIFDANNSCVRAGIEVIHACGIEDSILGSYIIPGGNLETDNAVPEGETPSSFQNVMCGRVYLRAKSGYFMPSSLTYEYGYQATNKKLFSGNVNSYSIIGVASGDKMTFNPEDLPTEQGEEAPIFRLLADPRQNGTQMCMPLFLNHDPTRWFMNFVKSLTYQNAPIIFSGASGYLLNDQLTNMSIASKGANFRATYPVGFAQSVNEAQAIKSGEMGVEAQREIADIEGDFAPWTVSFGLAASSAGRMAGANYDAQANTYLRGNTFTAEQRRIEAYNIEVANEKKQLNLRNSFVAPRVMSQATQTMRELVGNGFIIAKNMMCVEDLQRCDKLLNMYGYRHTKELEKSDFTNRSCYNYIEAGDVHLNYSGRGFSKWMIEGAEEQVAAGIRIWHTNYDPDYYVTGND